MFSVGLQNKSMLVAINRVVAHLYSLDYYQLRKALYRDKIRMESTLSHIEDDEMRMHWGV